MRNSTFLILGLGLMAALPSEAQTLSPLKVMKDVKGIAFGRERAVRASVTCRDGASSRDGEMRRMSEMARRIKPGVMKAYGWRGNTWRLDDTYSYTYDAAGNTTVENVKDAEGGYARTVSEYNGNNKVTFKETTVSDDGVNFENNAKSGFEYDPILTDVITQRTEEVWLMDEWRPGNCYKRIITRDDAGNITSAVIAVLFNGEYDPTIRLDIEYGEDGKASVISEQNLGYNGKDYYWEEGVRISDIVWERTDGQIYDVEDIFTGNNRIGSARYLDPDGLDMNVTVDYADDSEAYTANMSMTMEGMTVTAKVEYTPLENDGYMVESGTYFMGQAMYEAREEYRYDDWGLMTLQYKCEEESGDVFYEKVVGEVEYDDEGKPLTYTISEIYPDDRTGEEISEYVAKAEYSDYVDVSAAAGTLVTPEETGRCYDLNGMRVEAPEKGRITVKDRKAVMTR